MSGSVFSPGSPSGSDEGDARAELVRRAAAGDQQAWNAIVDRYSALVWHICRGPYRMSENDAADVAQTVWLRLVEHLPTLREGAALPGWLSTTTRNECLRVLRQHRRQSYYPGDEVLERSAEPDEAELDAGIMAAQRQADVLEALALLPEHCRKLIELLVADDKPHYADIGAALNMPIGSIGPTRARCLEKLRHSPVLRGWDPNFDDQTES